jgi:hypothetical protein
MKFQAPNSKLKRNFNHQAPIIGRSDIGFEVWTLELLWSLEVGIWSL